MALRQSSSVRFLLARSSAGAFTSASESMKASSSSQEAAVAISKVAQFSSSEAAALAAKKKHLGLGGGSLSFGSAKLSTFASSQSLATETSTAAISAVQAEAKKASTFFSKVAKAFAAIAGAVALALAGSTVALADAPAAWQWGFQDTGSSVAQAAVDLHHDVMFFVISIVIFVVYMLVNFGTKFHYSKQGPLAEKLLHNPTLEVIWTVIPTLIILLIAVPSLTLIYSLDQAMNDRPGLTVKVIGRQWYWSYEMHDHLQHKLVDPDRLVAIAEKSLRA